MYTDDPQKILSKFSLPSKLENRLLKSIEISAFSNGHMLITESQKADSLFIVRKGTVISHTKMSFGKFTDQGKEFTTMFWNRGDFIFCPYSYFQREASKISYQLVSDADIYCLNHSKLEGINDIDPINCSIFLRDILIGYMERYKRRVLELQSLTAWERYSLLLRQIPGIELNVSQEIIASYLGITPQSLSRLRKNRI